jgi:tight adherence protein B
MNAVMSFAFAALGLLLLPHPCMARTRLDWIVENRVVGRAPATPVPGSHWSTTLNRIVAARRRTARRQAELPAIVATLADEYAAGATVAAAFTAAAGASYEYRMPLAAAARSASAGDDVSAALATESDLSHLAVACAVAARAGSSLTTVLAGVRVDLEGDGSARRAVAASLTGPRTSAGLLAVLPIFGIALGAAMGAHPARVLLDTRPGLIALTAGAALDMFGLCWTFLIARRAMP